MKFEFQAHLPYLSWGLSVPGMLHQHPSLSSPYPEAQKLQFEKWEINK